MSNIMKEIDTYFNTVSDEQLTKDLLAAGFDLRCKDHPKYQAKRKPTSNCQTCLTIWADKSK